MLARDEQLLTEVKSKVKAKSGDSFTFLCRGTDIAGAKGGMTTSSVSPQRTPSAVTIMHDKYRAPYFTDNSSSHDVFSFPRAVDDILLKWRYEADEEKIILFRSLFDEEDQPARLKNAT